MQMGADWVSAAHESAKSLAPFCIARLPRLFAWLFKVAVYQGLNSVGNSSREAGHTLLRMSLSGRITTLSDDPSTADTMLCPPPPVAAATAAVSAAVPSCFLPAALLVLAPAVSKVSFTTNGFAA